ncbi:MAG TPA: glycosyltransferase family 39 protein [Bryobacteraceae bacterium]|nr:glycosyltransferase family 39 protein [Bryobacteraceae bacterium]
MPQVFYILFGALFTVAVMMALGGLALRRLALRFHRQEERLFAFVTGAALLSLLIFVLASVHLVSKGTFYALGIAILALAARFRLWRAAGEPLAGLSRGWRLLFWPLFLLFAYVYFINAMAPEWSPDGSAYHLGLVSRYLRAHGFYPIATDMYAHLSQGTELLYLFAYSIGRHSAAALVHFAFLLTLPLAMISYARRFGFTAAGVTGALFVFISPIVGYDGSTAYIDVAVTCVLFALFYLLQIWDEEREPRLLVLIGLLAGFAYAMKYTAFVAFPYAALFVAWKTFRKGQSVKRPLAVLSLCALVMVAPWAGRNWIWYGNPVSPFYNRVFPNPYIHAGLEQRYRAQLAEWGGVTNKLQIPVEATVRGGKLQGVLGPVFLLAPIALFALRRRQGRQLLLAALVFLIPYPANIGTRFLIPHLPFLALAMGLALENWKAMAPLLVVAHAISAWPPYMKAYCDPWALRIEKVPRKAAFRIESEEGYLRWRMPDYLVARMVEDHVPEGGRVLTFAAPPQAYTSREFLVHYQAALNNNLSDMLKAARIRDWQPTRRLTFNLTPQSLRRVRIVQTSRNARASYWSISEFRVYSAGRELPRDARWRLHASPNPFEIQQAFDNNPMTRWRNWQETTGGETVEVDFGRPERIDTIVLDATPDQWAVRLEADGLPETGPWRPIAGQPVISTLPPPNGMRRMITREVRWQGIEYLLVRDRDVIGPDMRYRADRWGITLVAETNGARLYRITD